MPGCNGRDRGCNITLPERVQTSVWSFFAREFEKFLKGVKQMNRKLCATPRAGRRWQDISQCGSRQRIRASHGTNHDRPAAAWRRPVSDGQAGRDYRILRWRELLVQHKPLRGLDAGQPNGAGHAACHDAAPKRPVCAEHPHQEIP